MLPVGACAVGARADGARLRARPVRGLARDRDRRAAWCWPSSRFAPPAAALPAASLRRRLAARTSRLLLAAIALIPLFRAGFATVEGQGQDAHLAVGTAQFLQQHPPTAVAISEPVDRVPLVWRSKQPIYYALAAVATLSGREVFESISALAAVMLALAALGFFLVARELLRAPPWAALCARWGSSGWTGWSLHTVMHPYFNQTWGFFAMPFAIVLAPLAAAGRRTPGRLALLALFLAVCGFAYPLALPIPLLVLAVVLWPERRGALAAALLPRPALAAVAGAGGAAAARPDRRRRREGARARSTSCSTRRGRCGPGAATCSATSPRRSSSACTSGGCWSSRRRCWRGARSSALRAAPRRIRLALVALFAFAVVFAIEFRLRKYGYYFHFKMLAFAGRSCSSRRRRGSAASGAGWIARRRAAADRHQRRQHEIGTTFDELPRTTLQLREHQRVAARRSLDPDRRRADRAELDRLHAPRASALLAAPAAEHELPACADLAQGRLHPRAARRRRRRRTRSCRRSGGSTRSRSTG